MIKAVFDGYFRSGTTFIWKVLKKNGIVLYEPLNPYMFIYMSFKNNLHIYDNLWQDYNNFSQEEILNLKRLHPNLYFQFEIPRDISRLEQYIDFFDKNDRKIILQTNRFAFHNDLLKKRHIPYFLIIRNEVDVYYSLIKGNKKLFNKLFNMFFNRNPFRIKDIADFVYLENNIPFLNKNSLKEKLYFFSRKEMFIVTWVMFNYFAIKNAYEIINYDRLSDSNYVESIIRKFRNNYDIDLSSLKNEFKKSNYKSYTKDSMVLKSFEKILAKYKLEEKYNYIKSILKGK